MHSPSSEKRCPFWMWHLCRRMFPPRRRCAIEGALLDELLVSSFLAPLLDADLRAQPHLHLQATDASPSSAGACSTPVSLEVWTLLHDLSEEKGCSEKLDWNTGFDASRWSFETRERRWPDWWWICRGSKVSHIGFGTLNMSTFLNCKRNKKSLQILSPDIPSQKERLRLRVTTNTLPCPFRILSRNMVRKQIDQCDTFERN